MATATIGSITAVGIHNIRWMLRIVSDRFVIFPQAFMAYTGPINLKDGSNWMKRKGGTELHIDSGMRGRIRVCSRQTRVPVCTLYTAFLEWMNHCRLYPFRYRHSALLNSHRSQRSSDVFILYEICETRPSVYCMVPWPCGNLFDSFLSVLFAALSSSPSSKAPS